jgi:ribonuclease R
VLVEGQPRRDDKTRERLAEAALGSSLAERRAMEVERAIVDLYRAFLMKSHIGDRFEGTVTAVVGSGVFVQLDAPFVDVLVRLEDLGHDHWEVDDDALRVVAVRSGDVVALGDRLLVEVIDAAILRRTVYARRVGGSEAKEGADGARPVPKRDSLKSGPYAKRDQRGKHGKPSKPGEPGRQDQGNRGRSDGRKPAPPGRAGSGKSSQPSQQGGPGKKGKPAPGKNKPSKGGPSKQKRRGR